MTLSEARAAYDLGRQSVASRSQAVATFQALCARGRSMTLNHNGTSFNDVFMDSLRSMQQQITELDLQLSASCPYEPETDAYAYFMSGQATPNNSFSGPAAVIVNRPYTVFPAAESADAAIL